MKTGIWQNVLKDKYFPHFPVWMWLRLVDSIHHTSSQTWKNLCNTLPIIWRWLAWKPDIGHSIIVGKDMILGLVQDSLLSHELVERLNKKGMYFLYQASIQVIGVSTGKSWLCSEDLDLPNILVEEWDCYKTHLVESGISLNNKPDELI